MFLVVSEYDIVTSLSLTDLSNQMKGLIQSEWQPFGSLTVAKNDNGDLVYAQPIVKYLDPDED